MSFKAPSATTALQRAAGSGTVDAITAVFAASETLALTLTDQTLCAVVSIGANTSATPTFNPDGLGAKTITTRGGAALQAGDIGPAGFVAVLEYSASADKWELLNPRRIDLVATGPLVFSGGASGASPAPQITMGSYFDNAGNPSISHIDLYGGTYGFGISTSSLNVISAGAVSTYIANTLTQPFHVVSISGGTYVGNLPANVLAQNSGTSGLNIGMSAKATTTTVYGGLSWLSNDAANQLQAFIQVYTDPTAANRRMAIGIVEQGVAWRNITLGESGGNVGVGTATPIYLLDVNGTLRASGAATLVTTLAVGGTATLSSTLGVTGAATFNSTLGVTGLATFTVAPTAPTYTATSNGPVFAATGGAAGTTYVNLANTNGTAVLGIEAAFSVQFVGGGVGVYESVVGTIGATTMHVITNNTSRIKITSAGLVSLLYGAVVNGSAQIITGNSFSVNGTSGAGVGIQGFVNSGAATKKWQIGPDGNGNFVVFNDATTGMYISYGATVWTANSDVRLKDDVQTIDNALERVLKMRGVSYTLKASGRREIGVIAQEMNDACAELVTSDGEYLGVTYDRIAPVLIEAVKELHTLIERLIK